jgi:hypothetical protein
MAPSLKKPIGVSEKEYFALGDWKCPNSPTGGHWWNCNVEPFVCKTCGKIKLPVNSDQLQQSDLPK